MVGWIHATTPRSNESDDIGVFSALKQARAARDDAWLGVVLFDSDEDCEAFARDEGLL